VADVHTDNRGYDLHAVRGREHRLIEVKGVWQSAASNGIRMTGNEVLLATQHHRDFYLYVIENCQDGAGRLFESTRTPSTPSPATCPAMLSFGYGQHPIKGSSDLSGAWSMTRMIERWFPCAEVSDNSTSGWGSGNVERNLFTWFAARPAAQAKAAVITAYFHGPEDEMVQKPLAGPRAGSHDGAVRGPGNNSAPRLSTRTRPEQASSTRFSGRGMIPLEAAGSDFHPMPSITRQSPFSLANSSRTIPSVIGQQSPVYPSERERHVAGEQRTPPR